MPPMVCWMDKKSVKSTLPWFSWECYLTWSKWTVGFWRWKIQEGFVSRFKASLQCENLVFWFHRESNGANGKGFGRKWHWCVHCAVHNVEWCHALSQFLAKNTNTMKPNLNHKKAWVHWQLQKVNWDNNISWFSSQHENMASPECVNVFTPQCSVSSLVQRLQPTFIPQDKILSLPVTHQMKRGKIWILILGPTWIDPRGFPWPQVLALVRGHFCILAFQSCSHQLWLAPFWNLIIRVWFWWGTIVNQVIIIVVIIIIDQADEVFEGKVNDIFTVQALNRIVVNLSNVKTVKWLHRLRLHDSGISFLHVSATGAPPRENVTVQFFSFSLDGGQSWLTWKWGSSLGGSHVTASSRLENEQHCSVNCFFPVISQFPFTRCFFSPQRH